MSTLADINDLKALLGITGSGEDALLANLISGASAFAESYMARTVLVTSYTEKYNGNGKARMMLVHRPIVSVSSLTINERVISPSVNNQAGYLYSDMEVFLIGYEFDEGFQNVSINYSAGLAASEPGQVPYDIQQAVQELAALKYRRRDSEGNKSKSLAGETVSFVIADMPAPAKAVFDLYKQVAPV